MGSIAEMGRWVEGVWVWDIQLRRSTFHWETTQLENLLRLIGGSRLRRGARDQLIWKVDTRGQFSVKSFCRMVDNSLVSAPTFADQIWRGRVPPKVELFVWQLLLKRIPVKGNIPGLDYITSANASCTWCGEVVETVDHLFISCKWSWEVWMSCMGWWGVSCCCPESVTAWWDQWEGVRPGFEVSVMWNMLFYATVWSLWLHRNEIVFKNKPLDMPNLLEIIKVRLVEWFKAINPECTFSSADMLRHIEGSYENPRRKVKPIVPWTPPESGCLKLNVDGAARGNPGAAGVGCIVRNSEGETRAVLSKSIGEADAIVAELTALAEGLKLLEHIGEHECSKVVVESDSASVVSWFNYPRKRNWKHYEIFGDLEEVLRRLPDSWEVVVRKIPRSSNSQADHWAKMGVDRGDTFWAVM